MDYEVVVVGGGIGGLTTAALLAARGVSVCLFERQSRPGGCVANVEQSGFTFEPTCGLYSGWEPGGLYERIFAHLPVAPPAVDRLSPAYCVRLPDGTEVAVSENSEQFEEDISRAFPECATAAAAFYRNLDQVNAAATGERQPAETLLTGCSFRFRRFVDVQLQALIQSASDQCPLELAALALNNSRRGMWSIRGGAQSLADALAESLKQSGGSLRLNAPVLRLAYSPAGSPTGVDLLSGERVTATRAIVSNLTIWDTYGKLIGLSRTPASISSQLRQMHSWGAYLIFMSLERSAAARLGSSRVLALTEWQEDQPYSPEQQFSFSTASKENEVRDAGASEDKLAVTVSTFTNVDDWFAFHQDEAAHEEQDQSALETLWSRLHAAMPELGDSVEVIETATPRTFYEDTRRKLGMVGRPTASLNLPEGEARMGRTIFPNLFLVSDTNAAQPSMAGVSASALKLAELIYRTV